VAFGIIASFVIWTVHVCAGYMPGIGWLGEVLGSPFVVNSWGFAVCICVGDRCFTDLIEHLYVLNVLVQTLEPDVLWGPTWWSLFGAISVINGGKQEAGLFVELWRISRNAATIYASILFVATLSRTITLILHFISNLHFGAYQVLGYIKAIGDMILWRMHIKIVRFYHKS